jgi:hypothetical protein
VKLTPVSCNNCGAPLEVADSTRFVTCAHCNSCLRVERTGNAVFTEMLEELEARTGQVEARTQQVEWSLKALRLKEEIEQLDRDRYEQDKVLKQQGDQFVPMAILGGVALLVIGLCIPGVGDWVIDQGPFVWFNILCVFLVAPALPLWHWQQSVRAEPDAHFQRRRSELTEHLREVESAAGAGPILRDREE